MLLCWRLWAVGAGRATRAKALGLIGFWHTAMGSASPGNGGGEHGVVGVAPVSQDDAPDSLSV